MAFAIVQRWVVIGKPFWTAKLLGEKIEYEKEGEKVYEYTI